MEKEKRREYGSGSVFYSQERGWCCRIQTELILPSGRKKTITRTNMESEKEANRVRRSLLKEFKGNNSTEVIKLPVSKFIENWLNNVEFYQLKETSFDRKEQSVRLYVIPYIGMIQVSSLTSADVSNWIAVLYKKGYSYSTIKKAYEALNGCFKDAIKRHILTFNPVTGVSLPSKKKFNSKDLEYFEKDEVRNLYEAARAEYGNGERIYRLGEVVVLTVNTGLRIAELLGLKWKNVDMKNRVIHVRISRVRVKNREGKGPKNIMLEQKSLKTDAGYRTIDLNDDAYEALLQLKTVTGDFEYVVVTEDGKPYYQKTLDTMLRRIEVRAGMDAIDKVYGFHALRHTFASLLFEAGEDVKVVSELLGHEDTSTTYNTYIHLIKGRKRSAVQNISNLL